MQTAPDTMVGDRENCANDIEVVILINGDKRILMLGIHYPCQNKTDV